MGNDRLFTTLAFAGALPFIATAILSLSGVGTIWPFGNVYNVAASYGLAILSFLAGTHWAFQLMKPMDIPFDLFISSNFAVVFVWLSYLSLHVSWVLAIQAITFVALLAVDYRLRQIGVVSRPYFRARAIATSAATISLLVPLVPR
jgi:hypothetical protein